MPEEKKTQVTGNEITDTQRQILDQMSGMEMAAVLMPGSHVAVAWPTTVATMAQQAQVQLDRFTAPRSRHCVVNL